MFQPTNNPRIEPLEVNKMIGYTTINNENGACGRYYAGVRQPLDLIVCNITIACLSPYALCRLPAALDNGAVFPSER